MAKRGVRAQGDAAVGAGAAFMQLLGGEEEEGEKVPVLCGMDHPCDPLCTQILLQRSPRTQGASFLLRACVR